MNWAGISTQNNFQSSKGGVMSSSTPTRKYSAGAGPRPGFHRQVKIKIMMMVVMMMITIAMIMIMEGMMIFPGHRLPCWIWRKGGDGTQV